MMLPEGQQDKQDRQYVNVSKSWLSPVFGGFRHSARNWATWPHRLLGIGMLMILARSEGSETDSDVACDISDEYVSRSPTTVL